MTHVLFALLMSTPLLGAAPAGGLPNLSAIECRDSLDLRIFLTPSRPSTQRSMSAIAVSEDDVPGARYVAQPPSGAPIELEVATYGGPPHGWIATIERPALGPWRLALIDATGQVKACQKIDVKPSSGGPKFVREGQSPVWRARWRWERDTEALYSVWIEHLFRIPLGQDASWNPLHKLTRDDERNLLHNHLGLDEDAERGGLRLNPDCADFPYYLRAYFAWKWNLPFGFRGCGRGSKTRAPRCGTVLSNDVPAEGSTRVKAMQRFLRKVKGTVHSSSLRTRPEDDNSDFYPVALSKRALRPGTIYTDPYGHTLMVAAWTPQKGHEAGVLMAADAQPDGTIGRRRFWKGSFLFPEDDSVKGAGFKRFRPVLRSRGGARALDNDAINQHADYGDYSVEQWASGKEGFYERMDALISPQPLPPDKAMTASVDALEQQVRRRVESVDNGEQWKRDNGSRNMEMPDGAKIFITAGPWEAYSTPSRDLRLLIAMDTVLELPKRISRYPKRFMLPAGMATADAVKEVQARLQIELAKRKITYKRSDGSDWTLTLADLVTRQDGFEMAYNPNDCVERRWGAAQGSEEMTPCQRHAPSSQRRKMESYRSWFKTRMRPR